MKRWPKGFLVLLGIGVTALSRAGYATPPSFDCSQAHEALALAICSSSDLSTLDLSFADAYQALRQQVGPQAARGVFQEAVAFQSTVNTACNLPQDPSGFDPSRYIGCIEKLYVQQRAAWVGRLSGPALEETDLPPQQLLAAQAQLMSLGYLADGSKIDGVFGPATRSAIVQFQLARSLPPTAFLDRVTFAKMLGGAPSAIVPATPVAPPAAPASSDGPADATQLAIARAEAAKAQADAIKAEADAAKAQAEAAAQIAITQRQAAAAAAAAAAQAAAKQKAEDEAKALQDAQGTSP